MCCRAIVAFLVLCSGASAAPLLIEHQSVVYLPETDEVRWRMRFDRAPESGRPGDFFGFMVSGADTQTGMGLIAMSIPLTTTTTLRPDEAHVAHRSGNQIVDSSILPLSIFGDVAEVVMPFSMLGVAEYDFPYHVWSGSTVMRNGQVVNAGGGSSRDGRAQFAVPEPASVGIAAIALACLAAHRFIPRCSRRRPR